VKALRIKLARHFRAHWLFYVLVVTGIFIDLGSKWLAFRSVPHRIVYVEDPFKIGYVKNTKAFESMFQKEYGSGLHPVALVPGEWPVRVVDVRPPRRVVIRKFFTVQLSFNPGAMFGMLPNVAFLIVFTVVAVGVIIWILSRLSGGERVYQIGLSLIGAGAVANLWDRMFHHAVRDFLDFSVEFWTGLADWLIKVRGTPAGAHWPTFNPADVFIVAGVVLILAKQFLTRKVETETPKES